MFLYYEKEMATHSSILAYRIPWTEEPDRLHSPWGCKESGMTEQLSLTHIISNCINYVAVIKFGCFWLSYWKYYIIKSDIYTLTSKQH